MKKNQLILLLFLAIAGLAAVWYLNAKDKTNLEGYDFHMAVKDTAAVYKIFLADRNGKNVTLTRETSARWQVNGQYRARHDAMQNLLQTVHDLDLQYRLPRGGVEPIVKSLATDAVKVEIYNKKGEKMRAYYVGGSNADDRGTYMMMEDANEPYVMHIPGFVGMLRPRYFTELEDWRDRFIFRLMPQDIQSVILDYPNQKSKSFKIDRVGGAYAVEPVYTAVPRIGRPVVQGMVEAYLRGFEKLGIMGYEDSNPKRDSFRNTPVFCRLTVVETTGKSKTVTLHPFIPRNEAGQVTTSDDGLVHIESYFADTNEGDYMAIQHYPWENIFWAYEAFFQMPLNR
jgi:hypothetical protein